MKFFDTTSDVYYGCLRVSKQVWADRKGRANAIKLEPYISIIHEILDLKKPVEVRFARVSDVHGECMENGTEVIVNAKLRFDHVLRTLCHEMVHAQQFQTGRLKFKNGYDIWEGNKWTESMSTARTPHGVYRSAPWEVEAYGLEKSLYKKLKNSLQSAESVIR